MNLIKKFDLKLIEQYENGEELYEREGKVIKYKTEEEENNPGGMIDKLIKELNEMASKLKEEKKWEEKEKEMDQISFKKHLESKIGKGESKESIEYFEKMMMTFITEADNYSLLYFLSFLQKCGSDISSVIDTVDAAQHYWISGGSQQISEKLYLFIKSHFGAKIFFDHVVEQISQNDSSVTVTTKSGKKFSARFCVSSLPFSILSCIRFDPPLPPEKSLLFQNSPMGSCIKCVVYYKNAFWREKGIKIFFFIF